MDVERSSFRGSFLPEAVFDELLGLATQRLAVDDAFVLLLGSDRFLGRPPAVATESTLASVHALATAVAAGSTPVVIDAADRTVEGHPELGADVGLEFFLGVPLVGMDGSALGALCAWDSHPRHTTPDDVANLEQYARHALTMIDLHRVGRELEIEREVLVATGHLLEMIVEGAELPTVLDSLALAAEDAIPGTVCSINLLDGTVLREGSSPHLPESSRRAIDGAEIGPLAGSCGTAAYTGRTVIVSDIATDPRWELYRDLVLPHGLRACWSVPIRRPGGQVLGTFALYYREVRVPEQDELDRLARWVNLAEVAISRARDIIGLREAATLDPLTGLVNRAEILRRIVAAQALSLACPAILFVDLDQFKLVNDTLGHAAGDQVLQVVARRLTGCAGPADTVARFGGDEFVVLCPVCEVLADAEALAHSMVEALCHPMTIAGRTLSVSASIGIAMRRQQDAGEFFDLVSDADLAMYAAKRAGRSSVAVFTPGLRAAAAEELTALAGHDGAFDMPFPRRADGALSPE
ncbi:diguanylate cyclase (GGDEF)-like protein [Nakamurella sp. UYEF19]|uniref:sensor domain-containing diguanylate cyclase n=1 Tax=Nakamurella sp. UYEF19 TaxID=1756392 RepID=UPI00339A38DD